MTIAKLILIAATMLSPLAANAQTITFALPVPDGQTIVVNSQGQWTCVQPAPLSLATLNALTATGTVTALEVDAATLKFTGDGPLTIGLLQTIQGPVTVTPIAVGAHAQFQVSNITADPAKNVVFGLGNSLPSYFLPVFKISALNQVTVIVFNMSTVPQNLPANLTFPVKVL